VYGRLSWGTEVTAGLFLVEVRLCNIMQVSKVVTEYNSHDQGHFKNSLGPRRTWKNRACFCHFHAVIHKCSIKNDVILKKNVTLYLRVLLIRWTSEESVKFGFCGYCTDVEGGGSKPSRVCGMQPLIFRLHWSWPSCVCVSHPWCGVIYQTKELSSLQALGNICLKLQIQLIIRSGHLPFKLSVCRISRLAAFLFTYVLSTH
jgi:hypothetical protein